ncbi:TniB family NTP-binding protein [Pararoseomonas sp. SCSIO 73927]|uniref:TniB family NTP-binding protein n=1 Tax=Pararoseomonas sp. SCSIO 73927 TaxID=3114537 RepID=UPI0030CF5D7A
MIVSARAPARDPRALGNIFVETGVSDGILRAINELIVYGHDAEHCRFLPILGEPRCGKTSLIRAFDRISDSGRDGFEPRRILEVQVPQSPTVLSIATAMLEALGDPSPATGSSQARTSRAMTLLGRGRYDVVVYDEIHRVVDGRTERSGTNAASWIIDVLNRRICPAIGIGEPGFAVLLEKKSYLDGRGLGTEWVRRADWEDKNGRLAFRAMLQGIVEGLGIATDFSIRDRSVAKSFWEYSEGRIGYVALLLTKARIIASRGDSPVLTLEHLHQAVNELALESTSKGVNPFDPRNPAGA